MIFFPIFQQKNRHFGFLAAALFVLGGVFAFGAEAAGSAGVEEPGQGRQEKTPGYLKNNPYYLESQRLARLARESFDAGAYGPAQDYAAGAQRQAQLSDDYVALQLKLNEVAYALARAWSRLSWAGSVGAAKTFAAEYEAAEGAYREAVDQRDREEWDNAIASAQRVMDALAGVLQDAPAGLAAADEGKGEEAEKKSTLPARYTVRRWVSFGDCLWNIAAQPWAYGDSSKWRVLYEANKDKLPNPKKPGLLWPGMVLDIPSIHGESRSGDWGAGITPPSAGKGVKGVKDDNA